MVKYVCLILLIIAGVFEAWWMTPGKDYYTHMDFAVYYTAARMYLHSQNPYDRPHAEVAWIDAGGDANVMDIVLGPSWGDEEHAAEHWLPIVLIPPALPVMAPFGLFRKPIAWPLWNGLVLVLLALQIVAIAGLMGVKFWHPRVLLVLAILLVMHPLHIGLANGQPTVPTISLIVLSLWLTGRGREVIAGILLAVAVALKPQLAAPFVLFFIAERRWKTVITSAVVGGVLFIVAVVPMHLNHHDWLAGWKVELEYAEMGPGVNNPRVENPGRHDMLHLQLLTHLFTDDAKVANAIAGILLAGFAAILVVVARKSQDRLGIIAAFSAIALLPVYHRYYDAGLLILAAAWAILHFNDAHRWYARGVLLVMIAFTLSQEWLDALFRKGGDDLLIKSTWWFNGLAEPHHTWEILLVLMCMLLGLWHATRSKPRETVIPQ